MRCLLNHAWEIVWRRYLDGCRVVRVCGWRTALVESDVGERSTITPLPKWVWWDKV